MKQTAILISTMLSLTACPPPPQPETGPPGSPPAEVEETKPAEAAVARPRSGKKFLKVHVVNVGQVFVPMCLRNKPDQAKARYVVTGEEMGAEGSPDAISTVEATAT